MSILHITNLTDDPEGWILDRYEKAFEELEENLNIKIDNDEKRDFIDTRIEELEELANKTLGEDLYSLIDNYLVNTDYYSDVKDWYENK